MSVNIHDSYRRAIAHATDMGEAPGRLLNAVASLFELKSDGFGILAVNSLWRRVGLVNAPITIDDNRFEVDSLYQPSGGWPAWVLPVQQIPAFGGFADGEMIDLVAFTDEGRHKGRVWRALCAADHVGLEHAIGQRVVWIFRDPKNWLAHWLEQCRENPKWLDAEETGPEAFGALVLDERKINWRTHRIEESGPLSGAQEILFADDPGMRDRVLKEMKLELPQLPRLRARKA